MSKRERGYNEAYKVATNDDSNYYLHDMSADEFVDMFINHMMQACSVLVESQQDFGNCYSMSYTDIMSFVQENIKLMKRLTCLPFKSFP